MNNLRGVAVVGCGQWGSNHVRTFHKLGILSAVCDFERSVAAGLADRYQVTALDFTEILRDDGINAVVIAAPAEQHFTLAREALLAGKHALVEKPLALRVDEAEELRRLADAHDAVLLVGHVLQYHPAFLRLKQMVEAGDLGRLQYIYSNRVNLGKIRREENILWSFAPHDVSMILALVGEEPTEVTATGSYYLHKAIADVTVTHLDFPGGERAHIFVSWLHPFKDQKLVVIGDQAMAVFDDVQPWTDKLRLYPHRIAWRDGAPVPEKAEYETVAIEAHEPLERECQHFLDCITGKAKPLTDGHEGLRVLRVLEQADRSMTTTSADAATQYHNHSEVMVHPTSCVDEDVEIGAGTRVWHFCHLLPRTRIGRNVNIGQNVMIGPDVSVGDDCKIQNNVSLYPGVELEEGVFCGPSCVFTNVLNPRARVERKDEFRITSVRQGATIGANATIVCGNEIGAYSMIGAGAVVTHDVPQFALMAGTPARRIGWISHDGERLGDDLVCPRSGRRYRQVDEDRLEEVLDD